MTKHIDPALMETCLDRLAQGKVLVVGDVMLDHYLVGDADRISPEAPVPVVKVEEIRHLLGGAGNVARNITALGAACSLVSVTGRDQDGEAVRDLLEAAGVQPHLVRSTDRPTTVKTRVLARNQQMIRLDRESALPLTDGEKQELSALLARLIPDFDVVIVSDYGKGVITESLLPEIRRCADARTTAGRPIHILVDPKPRNSRCYAGASLITPNAKEAGEASGMTVDSRDEILSAGHYLRRNLGVESVLITLGADGMALFEGDGVWHVPTTARQVFDVTGAGDTVIAVTGLALSVGLPLLEACVLANYAAGVVVGKVGASTADLDELRSMLLSPVSVARWA